MPTNPTAALQPGSWGFASSGSRVSQHDRNTPADAFPRMSVDQEWILFVTETDGE